MELSSVVSSAAPPGGALAYSKLAVDEEIGSNHPKRLGASAQSEDEAEIDESNEVSLAPLSWVLGLHFFATAITVPALPSLLLEILNGECFRVALITGLPDFSSQTVFFDQPDDKAEAARWNGWIQGLRALLMFLCIPALGALSDTRGRKVHNPPQHSSAEVSYGGTCSCGRTAFYNFLFLLALAAYHWIWPPHECLFLAPRGYRAHH